MRWIVQAVISTCQVLFMISRAPRVPWEAMYLPGTEAISYGMSFFGQGYILLANGKTLPWCRMAAWLCTVSPVFACAPARALMRMPPSKQHCRVQGRLVSQDDAQTDVCACTQCPIMLGMVSNMALIKYKSQPLNPIMVAASIIRTVFGISATMAETDSIIWVHVFFAMLCFGFEMICAYAIFALTIQDFTDVGSPLGMRVVGRLQMLRTVFFVTWCAFPILWFMSSTYKCVIDENVSAILYLMADMSCKNTYGLILWSTTWGVLNGKWDRDYARNRDANGMLMEVDEKQVVEPPRENFDVKMLGTTIASVRRSTRRPRADSEFVDRRDDRRDDRRRDRRRDYDSDRSSDEHYERRRGATRDEKRRDYDRDMHRTRRDDRSLSPGGMPSTNMGEIDPRLMPAANGSDQTMMALLEMLRRNTEAGADRQKSDSQC